MVNTRMSTPANAAGTFPRSIVITAVSGTTNGQADFLAVAPGGRSAGVVLSAVATGNAAGNKVSLTGSLATNTTKTINRSAAPDNAVSLPLNCTGLSACTFTATAGTNATYGDLSEVIQVTCPTGQSTCVPTITARVNVTLAHAGDGVNLPNGAGVAQATNADTGNFANNFSPSLTDFKAALQIVTLSRFASEFLFTRGGAEPITPSEKTLLLEWTSSEGGSSFSTMIPPGSFKLILKTPRPLWAFNGVDDAGIHLAAVIKQLDNAGKKFAVAIGGHGADLGGTDDQVTVRLSIGDQLGQALITPLIFP